MIRAGPSPPLSMARGPAGRHWTVHGSSLPRFPRRRLYNSSAHGWISEGFNPAAMFARWPGPAFSIHRPERSGLPSAVRGAGAVRLGLPSAVRGMPGVGRLSHCAASGAGAIAMLAAAARIAITDRLADAGTTLLALMIALIIIGCDLPENVTYRDCGL